MTFTESHREDNRIESRIFGGNTSGYGIIHLEEKIGDES